MSRAIRRHHRERVCVARSSRVNWDHMPKGMFAKWNQTCSCWACRPERGPSMLERKAPKVGEVWE